MSNGDTSKTNDEEKPDVRRAKDITREELAKMVMEISEIEGAGVFRESDGTISFNGINQKTYNEFRKRQGLPPKDVRQITVGETLDLVDKEFINRNGIENVPIDILPIVLDTSFNSGPTIAAKLLQRTVGADEDGIIGPKTMDGLQEYRRENNFINGFSETRTDFVLNAKSQSIADNRKGLVNRVQRVKQRELDKLNSGNGVTVNQ